MSWESNDLSGFNTLCKQNIGQISLNSTIGSYLFDISKNNDYNSYLEIGTWNGLGSTKCFVEGFKNRQTEFKFYSLECNKDKSEFAQNIYKDFKNIFILNEVLLNDLPNDIYNIFPELLTNETLNYWNKIDFDNMKDKQIFLNRKDIPQVFDVILLDGGEFTTWYEYLIIKDKCKILVLDDTNTNKCKLIVKDLENSNLWDIVFKSDERSGTAVYKRKYL
jgi:hypothetical protein